MMAVLVFLPDQLLMHIPKGALTFYQYVCFYRTETLYRSRWGRTATILFLIADLALREQKWLLFIISVEEIIPSDIPTKNSFDFNRHLVRICWLFSFWDNIKVQKCCSCTWCCIKCYNLLCSWWLKYIQLLLIKLYKCYIWHVCLC